MLGKPYPVFGPTYLRQIPQQLHGSLKGAQGVPGTIFEARLMSIFSITLFCPYVTEALYLSLHCLCAPSLCYTCFDYKGLNLPYSVTLWISFCTREKHHGFLQQKQGTSTGLGKPQTFSCVWYPWPFRACSPVWTFRVCYCVSGGLGPSRRRGQKPTHNTAPSQERRGNGEPQTQIDARCNSTKPSVHSPGTEAACAMQLM